MKHTLDPLPQLMASLRENEALYKKAFVRRCENLRKAENEVLFSISVVVTYSHTIKDTTKFEFNCFPTFVI